MTMMKSRRSLAAVLCLLPSLALAGGASQPPVGANTPITPSGASQAVSLGDIASGSRFLVPRDYIGLWKPFSSNATIDTGGTFFPTNKTAYQTIEVDDDYTAVQLVFSNQGANTYTVTNAAVSGSSQWAAPGYTGPAPGVVPYDATGAALTSMSRATFVNGGANSDAYPAAYGTNCLPTTAAAATNATALTFASTTGVSAAQVVATPARGGNYVQPNTVVASLTSTTVTLSLPLGATLPSGSSVCFLPSGVTAAAVTYAPVPTLTRSDWIPVSSQPRIDSPVVAGGLVTGAGIASGTTVAGSTATSVSLSKGLAAPIPVNSDVFFCRATTTTADWTPTATLSFASVPATVVPGMYARSVAQANMSTVSPDQPFPSPLTVTGISGGTVTLSQPLVSTVGSGAVWDFYQPLTLVAAATSGATTLTLSAAPANLATGMYLVGTGISGALGSAFTPTTTITAINGNVITLSAATTAAIGAGEPVHAITRLTTNAASTVAPLSIASSAGIYNGALLVGSGLSADTWAASVGNNALSFTRAPSAVIASGTTINACDRLRTSAAAPAGATSLTFRTTAYPRRLLTIRVNYGSANANFWLFGPSGSLGAAHWAGPVGQGRVEAGNCSASLDGVLAPSTVNSGTCGRTNWFPVTAVKFLTARRGVQMVSLGDSHFRGDTSYGEVSNLVVQAASQMTTLGLPVWTANVAFGGANSQTFLDSAWPYIQEVKPGIVVLQGYTGNDINTTNSLMLYLQNLQAVARYVRGYGGLPVIVHDYARQVAGCNTVAPAIETQKAFARAMTAAAANDNRLPVYDAATAIGDPVRGIAYLNPIYGQDCIHANNAAAAVMGTGLRSLLAPYLAN